MQWFKIVTAIALLVMPIELAQGETAKSQAESTCPDDIKQLTALLLKDLPEYSNRVIQRTQKFHRAAGIRNYIITAAPAESTPLSLPRLQYSPIDEEEPEQVFFTIAEKQYTNNKIATIQSYHWLFLTQTDNGWRTVMMFSRFGNVAQKPPTPPQVNY